MWHENIQQAICKKIKNTMNVCSKHHHKSQLIIKNVRKQGTDLIKDLATRWDLVGGGSEWHNPSLEPQKG